MGTNIYTQGNTSMAAFAYRHKIVRSEMSESRLEKRVDLVLRQRIILGLVFILLVFGQDIFVETRDVDLQVGDFFLRQGRERTAIGYYEAVSDSAAANAGLYYNLGIAYGRTERLGASRRAFRKAIELDPAFGAAHASLGVALLRDQNPREALQEFERALSLGHPVEAELIESLRQRLPKIDGDEKGKTP